jgi:hypothetical protein
MQLNERSFTHHSTEAPEVNTPDLHARRPGFAWSPTVSIEAHSRDETREFPKYEMTFQIRQLSSSVSTWVNQRQEVAWSRKLNWD